jgi:Transposase DDE domain group 1
MSAESLMPLAHLAGEQPGRVAAGLPVVLDSFAGRVHVEWEPQAPVTALGQLPFFVEFLKAGGLFENWVADCPLAYTSPNAPRKRDVLGTMLLSILAGHWRYAHITAVRGDGVNPGLLGMDQVVSEDSVRRALKKMPEAEGMAWLRRHLDYTTVPLLGVPWILDVDTTVKPLYGHQEGAVVGYNPTKLGRPSHTLHSYLVAGLRLVLDVEVKAGNEQTSAHSAPPLWALLERLGRDRWPWLLRGDAGFGTERIMSRAEQEEVPYLFKLRATRNVKRSIEQAMGQADWSDAGQGWQGKEKALRLLGWSRHRRVVILRRRLARDLMVTDHPEGAKGQLALSFVEIAGGREIYEYAVLVTSLDLEILSVAQLYRDRGDAENAFDETKNQWGWSGFTTHDLKRCQLMALGVGLIYNWWSLFGRLADPDRRREAITSRPLLMHAVARQTRHAGQITVTITSAHGLAAKAKAALTRIAAFFTDLRSTAEQLTQEQRWYRILSQALVRYLNGQPLRPPPRLKPA